MSEDSRIFEEIIAALGPVSSDDLEQFEQIVMALGLEDEIARDLRRMLHDANRRKQQLASEIFTLLRQLQKAQKEFDAIDAAADQLYRAAYVCALRPER